MHSRISAKTGHCIAQHCLVAIEPRPVPRISTSSQNGFTSIRRRRRRCSAWKFCVNILTSKSRNATTHIYRSPSIPFFHLDFFDFSISFAFPGFCVQLLCIFRSSIGFVLFVLVSGFYVFVSLFFFLRCRTCFTFIRAITWNSFLSYFYFHFRLFVDPSSVVRSLFTPCDGRKVK